MDRHHSIIKGYQITEKGSRLSSLNQYLFRVARNANKIEIRKAIEALYRVTVISVNTAMVRGKKKRVRYVMGKTSDWKKAIVTLKEGDSIKIE